MENILQTVKQFLEFSDEKLEELKKKNQMIKLQKDKKERNTGVQTISAPIVSSNFIYWVSSSECRAV